MAERRYIVAGAPCSGKSTYVRENAEAGDLVYDYDLVHQALSLRSSHQHNERIRPYVLAARDAIYDELRRDVKQPAWIITSTLRASDLSRLRDDLGAEVVLLEVEREEAHRRCDADSRPVDWHSYIDNWFDRSDIDKLDWEGKKGWCRLGWLLPRPGVVLAELTIKLLEV